MKFNRHTFFKLAKPTVEVPGIGLLQRQVNALNRLLDFIEADRRWDAMDDSVAIRTIAYFLATVAHECTIKVNIGGRGVYVKSFEPVEEMGGTNYLNRMYDTRTDLGNTPQRDGDGARYAGDGFVQNTGASNARKTGIRLAGEMIKFSDIPSDKPDLISAFRRLGGSESEAVIIKSDTFLREHELLRVPRISYLDAIDGMLTGRYTGRKVGDYINFRGADYFNVRRVINRITRKNRHTVIDMRNMAIEFEKVLFESLIKEPEVSDNYVSTQETPEPEPEVDEEPKSESADAAAFTAHIPNIDTAKRWLKTGFFADIGANVTSKYLNLPESIQWTLDILLVLIVIAAIVLFALYYRQVFTLVGKFTELRARQDTHDFNVDTHTTKNNTRK